LGRFFREFPFVLFVDRDILNLRQELNDVSPAIAHGSDMNDNLNNPAISPDVTLFDRVAISPAREDLSEKYKVALEIIWMREICKGSPIQHFERNSDKPRERDVAALDAAFDIYNCDTDRGMVEGKVEERKPSLGVFS
jgi:hypothetical protein